MIFIDTGIVKIDSILDFTLLQVSTKIENIENIEKKTKCCEKTN